MVVSLIGMAYRHIDRSYENASLKWNILELHRKRPWGNKLVDVVYHASPLSTNA